MSPVGCGVDTDGAFADDTVDRWLSCAQLGTPGTVTAGEVVSM
jgi:hypothetical protein